MLAGVAELSYRHDLGRSQPAQQHLQQVRRELADLVPIGMQVLVSGAGQSLPIVPWIAVLDTNVTTTAQQGLYVVYLYSVDLTRVYLSMNQGATEHLNRAHEDGLTGAAARAGAVSELHKESHFLQKGLSAEAVEGLLPTITLGEPKRFLPVAYEAGSVAAIEYNTDNLPESDTLTADLLRFLALYASCVEIKRDLRASDPSLIRTTAGPIPQAPPVKQPAFRPKSSADYIARVAAQSQVRARRHEALIRVFGTWVKSRGLVAATNVHPCDFTVDGDGHHWLVEAKTVGPNAEHAVREAIGQLFSYRHFMYRERGKPDPSLVALFTEPVGPAFGELLVSLGIEAVWRSPGSWDGRAPVGVASLLRTTIQPIKSG